MAREGEFAMHAVHPLPISSRIWLARWLMWLVATSVGSALGYLAGVHVALWLIWRRGLVAEGLLFGWPASGAVVGIAQWIVLRGWTPRALLWVPTNFVGFFLGPIVASILSEGLGRVYSIPLFPPARGLSVLLLEGIMWAAFGLVVGLVQSIALRLRAPRYVLWTSTNLVGFGLAGTLAGALIHARDVWGIAGAFQAGLVHTPGQVLSEAFLTLAYGMFGGVTGAITGAVLIWLRNHSDLTAHEQARVS